jgi:hypothetical protein
MTALTSQLMVKESSTPFALTPLVYSPIITAFWMSGAVAHIIAAKVFISFLSHFTIVNLDSSLLSDVLPRTPIVLLSVLISNQSVFAKLFAFIIQLLYCFDCFAKSIVVTSEIFPSLNGAYHTKNSLY